MLPPLILHMGVALVPPGRVHILWILKHDYETCNILCEMYNFGIGKPMQKSTIYESNLGAGLPPRLGTPPLIGNADAGITDRPATGHRRFLGMRFPPRPHLMGPPNNKNDCNVCYSDELGGIAQLLIIKSCNYQSYPNYDDMGLLNMFLSLRMAQPNNIAEVNNI